MVSEIKENLSNIFYGAALALKYGGLPALIQAGAVGFVAYASKDYGLAASAAWGISSVFASLTGAGVGLYKANREMPEDRENQIAPLLYPGCGYFLGASASVITLMCS